MLPSLHRLPVTAPTGAFGERRVTEGGFTIQPNEWDMEEDGLLLQWYPTYSYDYGRTAMRAVKQNGLALEFVPKDRDDYGSLARLALTQNGRAIQFVPVDRDDYYELAMMALAQTKFALNYIPEDHPKYPEFKAEAFRRQDMEEAAEAARKMKALSMKKPASRGISKR